MIVYLKYGEEESSPNPISLLSQLYGPLDHTYGKIKGGLGRFSSLFLIINNHLEIVVKIIMSNHLRILLIW
jgi:hypothetical protein